MGLQRQLILLPIMFGMRYVQTEDKRIRVGLLCLYIVSQLIQMGFYYMTHQKILQANDQTKLKEVDPKTKEETETTVYEYDLKNINTAYRSVLSQAAFALILWYFFGFVRHFLMQSITNVLTAVLDNKLVQIHIFGKPAEGDLERPFKAPENPLAEMLKGFTDPEGEQQSEQQEEQTEEITESKEEDNKVEYVDSDDEEDEEDAEDEETVQAVKGNKETKKAGDDEAQVKQRKSKTKEDKDNQEAYIKDLQRQIREMKSKKSN